MKKEEKLIIEEYENGIVLPQKHCNNGPRWGLGGVCDSMNHFVKNSFYDGGWATHGGEYEWEEEEYVGEEAIYIGMFTLHWGHFLIDMTGRMWCIRQLQDIAVKCKIVYLGEEEPRDNTLRFFELLGVKKEQLMHIVKPTRFKKVYVPEQSFKSCEWYTDEFIRMLNDTCDRALENNQDFSDLKNLEKIYFTRRKFSKAIVSEFGEEFFEKCFLENGYVAIAPEKLSLEEQIFIWNNAKEIVCINGTIPLNVVFCRNPELQLIVLNKTSILHENPQILLKFRNIKGVFLNLYKEPLKNYPKSLGEGPFLLWPTKEFKDFCEDKKIKIPYTKYEINYFFIMQQIKYYWSILGIQNKIKRMIIKLLPSRLKNYIKRFLKQC